MTVAELAARAQIPLIHVAGVLAPIITAIEPAVEWVQAHPFIFAASAFFGGGGIANLAARVLNRIPMGGWYAAVRLLFMAVSRAGSTRFGRPLWKPFETGLENFIGKTADAARAGLAADDQSAEPEKSLEMQADATPQDREP